MRRQLLPGLRAMLVFTVLLGIAYPLLVTGLSALAFGDRAEGSLIHRDGRLVGSSLIGQSFTGARYFQPRPSAAGTDGYDGTASGASNLGPTNPVLLQTVRERAAAYRKANGLAPSGIVPVDAVTASASGLDPHISPANATVQAARVAEARKLPASTVLALVRRFTDGPSLGFLGEPGVNVLKLNLALDGGR